MAGALASCTRTTELLPSAVEACVERPGPAIHLGGTDPQSCTGALSARFGRYALCSCDDLELSGHFGVGGPGGPPKDPGRGGPGPAAPAPLDFVSAVGTDGSLRVAGLTEVAGSLTTAGSGGATFVRGGHIQGNLRGGGNFTTMTTMGVWVSGEMSSEGDVSGLFKVVGGPLRVPAAAVVAPEVQSMGVARQPVSVPGPCGCGATPAIDLAGAIAVRRKYNANPAPSFESSLADVTDAETLDFSCGEYFLTEIRTSETAPLELRVKGRVAIFVAGDVHLGNRFNVTLEEDAELDLIVGGSFFMTGLVFGAPSTPARARLWVRGVTVSLSGPVQFGAAVYAPSAVFSADATLTLSGSLYVGSLVVSGDVRIAYDPNILHSGEACGVTIPPAD
jgi:hypothetical protein